MNRYNVSTLELVETADARKVCKMGAFGAKEVKFTTDLPLLQRDKNLIDIKLIGGIPINITVGCRFLFLWIKVSHMSKMFNKESCGVRMIPMIPV